MPIIVPKGVHVYTHSDLVSAHFISIWNCESTEVKIGLESFARVNIASILHTSSEFAL